VHAPQPSSLSVYRGQSRTGEGEGPGKTVLHGEQYIRIAPPLRDVELLETIRPWMTLDSDPADHQRLNDQLEAWSSFTARGFLFVVRLVSAGIYDRRAAYFAHGRAWRLDALPAAFDPGLHLGRSDVFDAPWHAERPAIPALDVPPAVVRIEQIRAESQTTARFLAQLLHAVADSRPLIIAAPVADFTSGSALHALVGLARAGLPRTLRRSCGIRVYSRFPELFLRHLGANLIVVPEEAASSAVTVRPGVTLLDRQGRRIAGKEASDRALEYATAVVERAMAIPEGLPCFAERLLDLPSDARTIPVTYNLAFAFSGPPDRKAEFLRRYLPRAADKFGAGVPWNEVIASDEWNAFPREALLDELLVDTTALTAGRRELLHAIEDGASRIGLQVDERLTAWWDAKDPNKLARLVELLVHEPPLVSARAAAERSADVPLERLARTGLLPALIQAEAQSGVIARRREESSELSRAATDDAVFVMLTRAVSGLAPEWARIYVRDASCEALIGAAHRWLDEPGFFDAAWADVPLLLLDRLRALDRPPAALAEAIERSARTLDVVTQLEIYLRLADLLARIQQDAGRETSDNPLAGGLWRSLDRLDDPQRETLERLAFDPEWRCLRLPRLALPELLRFATGFRNRESAAPFYEDLDRRMRDDPEPTADALARSGWWFLWRQHSRLRREVPADAAVLKRSALAWLASDAWRKSEATLEAWDAAMADLPLTLDANDAARLCDGPRGSRRWPAIPPFEEKQFEDLIARAGDLGVLADFVEAVAADSLALSGDGVLARSRFGKNLPPHALAWLCGDAGRRRSPLTLSESAYLHAQAGHRAPQALEARIESVADALDRDALDAVNAADQPSLWSNPAFLERVAAWRSSRPPSAIPPEVAKRIDAHLGTRRGADLSQVTFADELIAALVSGDADHGAWQQLARKLETDGGSAATHPLGLLARRICAKDLSRDARDRLAEGGWSTFLTATQTARAPLGPPHEIRIAKLYELAAAMLPAGAMGIAALQLSFTVADDKQRVASSWWVSVLRAMHQWKRHDPARSADDSESAAIALLHSHLEEPERQALSSAFLSFRQSQPSHRNSEKEHDE
jgi:hypothetical protein